MIAIVWFQPMKFSDIKKEKKPARVVWDKDGKFHMREFNKDNSYIDRECDSFELYQLAQLFDIPF